MSANLLGNGTESVVVWIALAVDEVWHGSALFPLPVTLLGVSLPAPHAFRSGSWWSWPPNVPRWVQRGPKIAPRWPQHASRYPSWPKARRHDQKHMFLLKVFFVSVTRTLPRWPQEAPSWPPDGPKRPPDGPKRAQESPKMAAKCFKRFYLGPEYLDIIKTIRFSCVFLAQAPQRWPQLAPSWPKDGPKMGPRWPPTGPKMVLRPPKMAPKGVQYAFRGTGKRHLHPSFNSSRLKSPPEAHLVTLGAQLGRCRGPRGA